MEKINNTNIFRINKDFNIPNNHQTTFQSTFSYLRKKLQVKYTRKTHIDSLLKKCKGKFFKAVHDCRQFLYAEDVIRQFQIGIDVAVELFLEFLPY